MMHGLRGAFRQGISPPVHIGRVFLDTKRLEKSRFKHYFLETINRQPTCTSIMASNLVAMASNLIAMASNLIAMASNLIAMEFLVHSCHP